MRAPKLFATLLALILILSGPMLLVIPTQPASAQTGSTTFDAAPAPAQGTVSELTDCSRRLEECDQDSLSMPFLGAAYGALWVILMIYLSFNASRNAKLREEIEELRARLLKAERTGTR
ncbi:MAG: hypothetical protein ACI9MR_000304 [Myxococcota bacterium]|jgi:hypothetical protein